MLDYPVRQRLLEPDIPPRFFRLNPFMPEYLIQLGLEFFVQ